MELVHKQHRWCFSTAWSFVIWWCQVSTKPRLRSLPAKTHFTEWKHQKSFIAYCLFVLHCLPVSGVPRVVTVSWWSWLQCWNDSSRHLAGFLGSEEDAMRCWAGFSLAATDGFLAPWCSRQVARLIFKLPESIQCYVLLPHVAFAAHRETRPESCTHQNEGGTCKASWSVLESFVLSLGALERKCVLEKQVKCST